jgi:quercetin dioxygenase-like cupin family protein
MWDKTLSEAALLRQMENEGMRSYRWSNNPGDTYAAHEHDYHKVIFVIRGSITFILPDTGEEAALHPGDRLDLPAGVRHEARVGPQGVVCIEGHLRD